MASGFLIDNEDFDSCGAAGWSCPTPSGTPVWAGYCCSPAGSLGSDSSFLPMAGKCVSFAHDASVQIWHQTNP